MPDAATQIDLGTVETLLGNLQFTFIVSAEGDAHVQVDAANPIIMLDAQGYERLKAIIRGADGIIDRMIREGKIKRMVLPY